MIPIRASRKNLDRLGQLGGVLAALTAILVACSTPSSTTAPVAVASLDAATVVTQMIDASGPVDPESPLRQRRAHVQPAAPAPDTRTAAQIATAACNGRCVGTSIPKLMAASSQSPIIPPSWTVPAWFIDPANSLGCALDSNSGTSATCTGGCTGGTCPSGIGPLATYQQLLVQRWGCLGNPTACPRLRQNTTITWLSSQSNNSDPVYLRPAIENGAQFTITGPALTTLASGKLANVTAKNRASNTFPFQANFGASGAVGRFFSCTHVATTGFAWLNTLVSGTTFTTTQPQTASNTYALAAAASEVDTCANGDAFTLFNTMPSVDLVDFEPQVADNNGAFNNIPTISHIVGYDPSGVGNDALYLSDHVAILESLMQRDVIARSVTGTELGVSVYTSGVVFAGGVQIGNATPTITQVTSSNYGGELWAGSLGGPLAFYVNVSGSVLVRDIVINGGQAGGSLAFLDDVNMTQVFVPTGILAHLIGSNVLENQLYGAGTANVFGNGRLAYPSGAGGAVAALPISGGLTINGLAKSCLAVPSAGASYSTCNLTTGVTALDANLGATTGCLSVGGGGAICNTGTQ